MSKELRRHRQFEKNFKKRIASDHKLRAQFVERLRLFVDGERGQPLNDHALTGKLKGKRAFSVTGDIRAIYEENENEIIFLDIGTHAQVYGS